MALRNAVQVIRYPNPIGSLRDLAAVSVRLPLVRR